MGTWFQWIADVDASDGEAPVLAHEIVTRLVEKQIILPDVVAGAAFGDPGHEPGPEWAAAVNTPERWTPDGVRIDATRTVFYGGQGGYDWAQCPRCDRMIDGDLANGLLDGVEVWLSGDPSAHPCPGCGGDVPLPEWRWDEDYFAFAALGLWFWDWPRLGPAVHECVRAVVGTHRLVYRAGKL
ncbi:hypothetical protein [Myceligenerans indicum]|uniref:Uncharacterized protein n=1 Tax=Myceligenerans indicum TaxID=2593663 RepID=A0ABS1LPS3_9MICO|nr:hypothetical protein [Myceligenerans indicum]MBL0888307.1 hypothetical protein [Myceligenerans indicum]